MPEKQQRREHVKRLARDGKQIVQEETPTASMCDVPDHPAIRDAFSNGLLKRIWGFSPRSFVTLRPGPAGCDA